MIGVNRLGHEFQAWKPTYNVGYSPMNFPNAPLDVIQRPLTGMAAAGVPSVVTNPQVDPALSASTALQAAALGKQLHDMFKLPVKPRGPVTPPVQQDPIPTVPVPAPLLAKNAKDTDGHYQYRIRYGVSSDTTAVNMAGIGVYQKKDIVFDGLGQAQDKVTIKLSDASSRARIDFRSAAKAGKGRTIEVENGEVAVLMSEEDRKRATITRQGDLTTITLDGNTLNVKSKNEPQRGEPEMASPVVAQVQQPVYAQQPCPVNGYTVPCLPQQPQQRRGLLPRR
jgi:hypothetical protein